MKPKHPIGSDVYITDKFEPEYMRKGKITGYINGEKDYAYWVRVESDDFYENIFFHNELQLLISDLTPADVSGELLLEMAVNGLLSPLDDPFGAVGGRKSGG